MLHGSVGIMRQATSHSNVDPSRLVTVYLEPIHRHLQWRLVLKRVKTRLESDLATQKP